MKVFAVALFVGLVAVARADPVSDAKNVCYNSVSNFCNLGDPAAKDDVKCSAQLSYYGHSNNDLSEFANLQLEMSYKYLMLAAQFNSFVKDRAGFYAHFKALSDRSWQAGMDLITYMTKRGGSMKFNNQHQLSEGVKDVNEFQAMATVLDAEKVLFEKARKIHQHASHVKDSEKYDPEVAHYIEEEHLSKLSSSIRKYAGYANDLKNMYASSKDINMDNYLFDQYLQKA